MIINDIKKELIKSWSKNTCTPYLKEQWSISNPSLGQCAITSLIVNDFCGGKIMKCMTPYGSHYYSLINNEVIDLTVEQFNGYIPDYKTGEERSREYLLSNNDTKNRYYELMKNLKFQLEKSNSQKYQLISPNGVEYKSNIPGTLGGNKKLKIYGKLDCPSAIRWIRKGYYIENRVFFENEDIAKSAGYRPCAICMKKEYEKWKNRV